MIETIRHENVVIAIIIYRNHPIQNNSIEFLSPLDYSLQVGVMRRPKDYKVTPHCHNPVNRHTTGTQEFLIIVQGRIKIDFFSYQQLYLESRELSTGDAIQLCGAGHGITILEETIMYEVKNGPFIEGTDKGRFEGFKS